MDAQALLAGLGAVLTGAGGVFLVISEYRRRDRLAARKALDTYSDELYNLGQSYIELRRYTFEIRKMLADLGIDTMEPPRQVHPTPIPVARKERPIQVAVE